MKKGWLLLGVGIVFMVSACTTKSIDPTETIDYYNSLIHLQQQSVLAVYDYYQHLDSEFKGDNMREIYENNYGKLVDLHQQAEQIMPYQKDHTLKNALINYISGLQTALSVYEVPMIEYFENFTGQIYSLAKEYQQVVAPLSFQFIKELERLDNEFLEVQHAFLTLYQLPIGDEQIMAK